MTKPGVEWALCASGSGTVSSPIPVVAEARKSQDDVGRPPDPKTRWYRSDPLVEPDPADTPSHREGPATVTEVAGRPASAGLADGATRTVRLDRWGRK